MALWIHHLFCMQINIYGAEKIYWNKITKIIVNKHKRHSHYRFALKMSHSIVANKIENVMTEMWQMMHNINTIAVTHCCCIEILRAVEML